MGNWTNSDGLYLQFGTDKTTVEAGGDYKMPGANRVTEVLINLANLNTSSATIVSNTTFFPTGPNTYIEAVEVIAEQGMSTTSSPTLSVGLIKTDRTTVPTNGGTAFVNAAAASTLSTTGNRLYLVAGSTAAGGFIGDWEATATAEPGGYLTAQLGTATATGIVRVRIYWHGVGTIPN